MENDVDVNGIFAAHYDEARSLVYARLVEEQSIRAVANHDNDSSVPTLSDGGICAVTFEDYDSIPAVVEGPGQSEPASSESAYEHMISDEPSHPHPSVLIAEDGCDRAKCRVCRRRGRQEPSHL
jgi:hypothetical protein